MLQILLTTGIALLIIVGFISLGLGMFGYLENWRPKKHNAFFIVFGIADILIGIGIIIFVRV